MYKRVFTAIAAFLIVLALLFILGPMGVPAVCDPRYHIVAQVR